MAGVWSREVGVKLAQNERAEVTTPNGEVHIWVYPDGQMAVRFLPQKGWAARVIHTNANTGEVIVDSKKVEG